MRNSCEAPVAWKPGLSGNAGLLFGPVPAAGRHGKEKLLLSQVCAFPAQTVRKQTGWKHPAWREAPGMAEASGLARSAWNGRMPLQICRRLSCNKEKAAFSLYSFWFGWYDKNTSRSDAAVPAALSPFFLIRKSFFLSIFPLPFFICFFFWYPIACFHPE